MLNELRYNINDFDMIYEDDVIIVFRGNVYPIFINDTSEGNIQYIINIIREICKVYDGMSDIFFNPDGTLRDMYIDNPLRLLNAFGNFEGLPKLLYGYVTEYEGHYALQFDNTMYDVVNSNEFGQLFRSSIASQFEYFIFNDKAYTYDEILNGEFDNKRRKNTNISPTLYHGTTSKYIYGIMTKGIRQVRENSRFNVENTGYVYLTSIYESAYNYAQMYAVAKGGEECVVVVDTKNINRNNIVLDYDFAAEYSTDIESSPYNGRIKPRGSHYKGDIASNSSDNGTKFGKIGYKGVIMPNAIKGAYIYENGKRVFHDRDEILRLYGPSEGVSADSDGSNAEVLEENTVNGSNVIYYGLFLDNESRSRLMDLVPDNAYKVFCDHMTLAHRSSFNEQTVGICEKMLGKRYIMKATRIGRTDNVMAVGVETDCFSVNGNKHITLCTLTPNGKPVESNYITEWFPLKKPITLSGVVRGFTGNGLREDKSKKYVEQGIMMNAAMGDMGMAGCVEESSQLNEVEADDISLKSFEIQDELNPKFWIDGKINSRVRLKLLDLADEFFDSLNIKWVKPKDIVLTGSIANYNWSKYSDIDVHILVDYKDVWEKTDFVKDYFDSKKQLWSEEHDTLRIYGFPVEMYVEDANAENPSTGIYSLNKNKWIVEPNDFQDAELNKEYIKNVSAKLMTQIDDIDEKLGNEKDSHKLETLSTKMKKLFDRLTKQRKESLEKYGEMGTYNIIWKVLRRSGYLDKIWDIINTVYNKVNSIK